MRSALFASEFLLTCAAFALALWARVSPPHPHSEQSRVGGFCRVGTQDMAVGSGWPSPQSWGEPTWRAGVALLSLQEFSSGEVQLTTDPPFALGVSGRDPTWCMWVVPSCFARGFPGGRGPSPHCSQLSLWIIPALGFCGDISTPSSDDAYGALARTALASRDTAKCSGKVTESGSPEKQQKDVGRGPGVRNESLWREPAFSARREGPRLPPQRQRSSEAPSA